MLQFAFMDNKVSLSDTQIATAVGATTLMLWLLKVKLESRKTNAPTHKDSKPVIGSSFDVLDNVHRYWDWLADETDRNEGRPWAFYVMGRPVMINISTPDLFQDILKTQFENFGRGGSTGEVINDIFGKGILGVDGDQWYFQRKATSHLFSMQMMKTVIATTVRDKTKEMVDVLSHFAKSGEELSLKELFGEYTTDVFVKLGLGVDLGAMKYSYENKVSPVTAAIDTCLGVSSARILQSHTLWKVKRLLNIGSEKELHDSVQVVNQVVYTIMQKNAEQQQQRLTSAEDSTDLLSAVMDNKLSGIPGGDEFQQDMAAVRDMVVNFVLAGKDTSSVAISWYTINMNRYPEIARKVREEIKEKVPKVMEASVSDPYVPTMDEVSNLTYLEATLRESLRLTPSVALTAREANQDTTLVDGTFVPKGGVLLINMYSSGRTEAVWGEDAREFRPERWIDEKTGRIKNVSSYQFPVFLCGPRECLGKKFAMMEMKMALATIMGQFDITVEKPWEETYEISIASPVKGPLNGTVKVLSQSDLQRTTY